MRPKNNVQLNSESPNINIASQQTHYRPRKITSMDAHYDFKGAGMSLK